MGTEDLGEGHGWVFGDVVRCGLGVGSRHWRPTTGGGLGMSMTVTDGQRRAGDIGWVELGGRSRVSWLCAATWRNGSAFGFDCPTVPKGCRFESCGGQLTIYFIVEYYTIT